MRVRVNVCYVCVRAWTTCAYLVVNLMFACMCSDDQNDCDSFQITFALSGPRQGRANHGEVLGNQEGERV